MGGGVPPNKLLSSDTSPAFNQLLMPCFQTKLSRLKVPADTICCSDGKVNGPCCCPFTATKNDTGPGIGGAPELLLF